MITFLLVSGHAEPSGSFHCPHQAGGDVIKAKPPEVTRRLFPKNFAVENGNFFVFLDTDLAQILQGLGRNDVVQNYLTS